jgi:hypothetical protein|tara:strand:+ start:285 stop:626 length:342 start_codon:yes stop_codon:yes gene_type:complete
MRYFDKEERTIEQIEENEVDVNALLGLNNYTMPIQGFADPFITACFITDDLIFIDLFYNNTLLHYHFIYDCKKRCIKDNKIYNREMKCTHKNFPQKSFYNDIDNMVHIFYRQG